MEGAKWNYLASKPKRLPFSLAGGAGEFKYPSSPMMTLRPDPHEAAQEPIRFPPLLSSLASLSPMGKSLLVHFIVLSQPKLIVTGPRWKKILRPLVRRS